MSITHRSNLKEPTVSPFLRVVLDLLQELDSRILPYLTVKSTSTIIAFLCSLVFLETFDKVTGDKRFILSGFDEGSGTHQALNVLT